MRNSREFFTIEICFFHVVDLLQRWQLEALLQFKCRSWRWAICFDWRGSSLISKANIEAVTIGAESSSKMHDWTGYFNTVFMKQIRPDELRGSPAPILHSKFNSWGNIVPTESFLRFACHRNLESFRVPNRGSLTSPEGDEQDLQNPIPFRRLSICCTLYVSQYRFSSEYNPVSSCS